MRAFEENLLNKLLDKYEHSKLSKGETANKRTIKLTLKDKELSSYLGHDSYKYAEENDAVIREIERKRFVTSKYKNEDLQEVILNIDNINALYQYLRRDNPNELLCKIEDVLKQYHFTNFMGSFVSYVQDFISEKHSYPKVYFKDDTELNLLLTTFEKMLSIEECMKKREFSARYLGDSKMFETIQGKVVRILKDFDDNYASDDEALSAYNIISNTTYALVKNKLKFKINNSLISLEELGFEFSLSDEMIEKMEVVDNNINKVITVENLTTFYSLNEDALIIYLGGFHNHSRQMLLKKIYSSYPKASYYHFGDIDAGGIWIYKTLIDKTGIPFTPYRMGLYELEANKDRLKQLTTNDKKRLEKMLNDENFSEFTSVIDYMLKYNVKLEQELLD